MAEQESKITVSYSLPPEIVRAIEYRAFLDRTTKSEAVARLVRRAVGVADADDRATTDRPSREPASA